MAQTLSRIRTIGAALKVVAFALALCSVVAPAAQTPAPQPLTYAMAQRIVDAAEAEARRNKWNVTIVVTDAAGIPVHLRRMDGASPVSFDFAMRKAITVTGSGLSTAVYAERLKAGQIKEVPNGVTFAGGLPIMRGTEVIGAVATSGVQALQDEQVSKAGLSALQ